MMVRSMLDALGLRIDQEQRDAVRLVVAAGGARRHDQQVGHVAVDHEGLCALQLEAVAGAGGLQRDRVRTMLRPLVDRERADDRSVGDLRQMLAPSAPCCRRATAPRPRAPRMPGTATASACGRSPRRRSRPRRSRAPEPPNSSGTSRPVKPISPNVFQRSREKPSLSLASRSARKCDTGALSVIRPRALSRSSVCSSVRTRAMVQPAAFCELLNTKVETGA